ncbi:MAG: phosphatase family protein [Cellvibrio sp.]|jgi:undecaprenyl-diphosphatase|nr:phosphatase family protein [Cellvibrio sp.]MDF3013325.1 phosphatase family protein [Cellvibrio sp.]
MNTFLQRVHHLDTLAFLWVHVTKGFQYRRSVKLISHTGDGPLYLIVALGLLAFEPQVGATFFWAGIIAYVFDVSLYLLLKNLIKRDRPAVKISSYQAWITPSDQFSFPSGHTAAAFLFACLVFNFYPIFAIPCFIWASAIGISRVLLGVHYPTDLVAGALLGSVCAFWGIYLHSLIVSLH